VDALDAALRREVQVVFLVPGKAHADMVAGLRNPESEPFRNALGGLGNHPNFALAGVASSAADGQYQDIYVHSKIALIDDAWCTIGSTNIANRSFYGDTELNASYWHAPSVRALRRELFQEHTGIDTVDLDDRAALRLFATRARENAERRARGEPLHGLAFALDPSTYAR
jgi:cardiolipin synthase